ncbi:hypothetical protein [Neorhizobium sp. P12A]|uniref:hypothetical protein n=1 Tax=Neorhizobium sp. P12A TaxID=2268027 RepID=UPI0011EEEFB5|nr:hypothetical protein [Neorhizobium sp. P12A]
MQRQKKRKTSEFKMQNKRNAIKGGFMRFFSSANFVARRRRKSEVKTPAIHPSVLDGFFG